MQSRPIARARARGPGDAVVPGQPQAAVIVAVVVVVVVVVAVAVAVQSFRYAADGFTCWLPETRCLSSCGVDGGWLSLGAKPAIRYRTALTLSRRIDASVGDDFRLLAIADSQVSGRDPVNWPPGGVVAQEGNPGGKGRHEADAIQVGRPASAPVQGAMVVEADDVEDHPVAEVAGGTGVVHRDDVLGGRVIAQPPCHRDIQLLD